MSELSIAILVIAITIGVVLFVFFGGLGIATVYIMRLGQSSEKERAQRERADSKARIEGTLPLAPDVKNDNDGKAGWLTKLRNSKFARAFYIIGGWWILVSLPWAFGLETITHFLFVDQIWPTVVTPFFACACEYYLGKDAPRIMKGIAISVIIGMLCAWLWLIGHTIYTSKLWKDWANQKSRASEHELVSTPCSTVVLPTIVATKDRWTTPVDLKEAFWQHFKSYGGGKLELDYSGPVKARLVFNGKSREVSLTPGSKPDYGPVDELSFQAPGDANVNVHIIISR